MDGWKAFMESSTIHGLPELVKSATKKELAIYLACFLLAISFTLYGCIQVLIQYQTNEAITTYFVQETDALALPDITICPFNRIKKDFIVKNNISEGLASYIEWAFLRTRLVKLDFVETSPLLNQTYRDQFIPLLDELLEEKNITFEELLHDASLSCSDIVTACFEKLYSRFNCCEERRDRYVFSNLGRCILIKRGDQKSAGIGQGIMVFIKLPVNQFVLGQDTALNDGVLLKLSEQGRGYESDAIFIPTQVHALVQLRATKFEFMQSATKFGCVEERDDYGYSPFACNYKCILRPSVEHCGCRYLVAEPDDGPGEVCKPDKLMNCILPYLHRYIVGEFMQGRDHIKKCRTSCPPRCSYWQYSATVSHATYPSKMASKRFGLKNQTGQQDEPELVVEVYHEKLEFTRIRHVQSITFDQLVSDFGGQIGLWLGASILSLIHVFVFAFQSWCKSERVVHMTTYQDRKKRKKKNKKKCSLKKDSKEIEDNLELSNDANEIQL